MSKIIRLFERSFINENSCIHNSPYFGSVHTCESEKANIILSIFLSFLWKSNDAFIKISDLNTNAGLKLECLFHTCFNNKWKTFLCILLTNYWYPSECFHAKYVKRIHKCCSTILYNYETTAIKPLWKNVLSILLPNV